MHKTLSLVAALLVAAPVLAETQVGVSIGISQPGVYGRIDIGNAPPPMVVLPQPVIIAPPPTVVLSQRRPIYLYVPADHQRNWARYCGRYGACGQPVYFVQERWVRERYEERERQGRGDDHPGKGHGKAKGHDKGNNGKGNGKGRDD